MDRLTKRYGRSGAGRASMLRLIGAYMIFQTEGGVGLRKRGFSRDSIQLYREKLREAGIHYQMRRTSMPEEQIATENPDAFRDHHQRQRPWPASASSPTAATARRRRPT